MHGVLSRKRLINNPIKDINIYKYSSIINDFRNYFLIVSVIFWLSPKLRTVDIVIASVATIIMKLILMIILLLTEHLLV